MFTDIGECIGEVPPFEDLLVDEISMVCSREPFGDPTLLEEREGGLRKDRFVPSVCASPPEVVEVVRVPTLFSMSVK